MAKRTRGNVEATLRHARASAKRDIAQNARLRAMQAQIDAQSEEIARLNARVFTERRKR